MERICGIYCIKNVFRNKMYIGKSTDIDSRIRQHYSKLHRNLHHSHKLQNSWNKYPDEYFISGIIEECPVELLDQREAYYVDFYDSYNNGFNETIPNGENSGHVFTDLDKSKHSIIMKRARRLMSSESKQRIVDGIKKAHKDGLYNYDYKINAYNSATFEFEMDFKSIKDCAIFLSTNTKMISKVLCEFKTHKRLSYKGFILLRDKKCYDIDEYLVSRNIYNSDIKFRLAIRSGMGIINSFTRKYDKSVRVRNNTESRLAAWKLNSLKSKDGLRLSGKLAVDIYKFDTGEYIGRWRLLSDFALEYGLNVKYLQRAMCGQIRYHKNFVVKRVN